MAFLQIAVLLWADWLAWYSIWIMTTYLTNVWKLGITHAATIVYIWVGISHTSQLIFRYLVDTFFGHLPVLLFSVIAYCIGLGFLTMSTPPVLSNSTGTCSDYKPECIGETQKILFYIGMSLIALGMSGHTVSLLPCILEQNNSVLKVSQLQILGSSVILFPVVGGIALPYIEPWSIRFGIPAIFSTVATFVFLSTSCSYIHIAPEGSPLNNIFRVIKASICKIMWKLPDDPMELYDDRSQIFLPHSHGLRYLDKAAIKLPPNEELKEDNYLCSVTEVELTKKTIRILPIWITFIMCGVVSSLGNTYFQEQANRMNPKIGKVKVPLQVLLLVYEGSKVIFDYINERLMYNLIRSKVKRYAQVVVTALAMVLSILCCIIAAIVEARRLHVVKTHDLLDKLNERIPMSMFWLVPQYLLLAGLDSFIMKSVGAFFSTMTPPSMELYFRHFGFSIYGVGCFISVLLVFTVGKISEGRGNSNWFQYTLNQSRLDNYYWTLAALSTVNLVFFIWIGIMKSRPKNDELPGSRLLRTPGLGVVG